jgi:hypothetical protein
MLAHAEIVVGAPDGDFTRIVRVIAVNGARKASGYALKVGKDAIALLGSQCINCIFENAAIIHGTDPLHVLPADSIGPDRNRPKNNRSCATLK